MKGGDVNPWNLVGMSSIRAATRKEKCLHPKNWIDRKVTGLYPTKASWPEPTGAQLERKLAPTWTKLSTCIARPWHHRTVVAVTMHSVWKGHVSKCMICVYGQEIVAHPFKKHSRETWSEDGMMVSSADVMNPTRWCPL